MIGQNLRRWASHGSDQNFVKHGYATQKVKMSKGQRDFVFQKLRKQKFNSYILTLSENEESRKREENALSNWV